MTDGGLKFLSSMEVLRELHLAGCRITGEGLQGFRGHSVLERLVLAETGITDSDIAHTVSTMSGLRELFLDHTRVTDAAVPSIAGMRGLEVLSLDGTSVSDSCIDALVAMPSLSRLHLCNTLISESGRARFNEKEPLTLWPCLSIEVVK